MSTEKRPLGVAEVRALLARAVEEKGADYVYVNPDGDGPMIGECVYFGPDGSPSCIVGHVFAYAGVNYATEGMNAWGLVPDLLTTDQGVRWGLDAAQNVQDGGGTWGEALAAFDEAVAGDA